MATEYDAITVVHENPVWQSKSNFLIAARIAKASPTARYQWEQLWVHRVSHEKFSLCCIPFFIYDASLGDTLIVNHTSEGRYELLSTIEFSGRYTFRAWLSNIDYRMEFDSHLNERRLLREWRSNASRLVAIDASDAESAGQLSGFLLSQEEQGLLSYETGRL